MQPIQPTGSKPPLRRRWWAIVIYAVVLLGIGSGIGSAGATSNPAAAKPAPAAAVTATATVTATAAASPAPTVTVTASPAAPPAGQPATQISADGVYMVGQDIKAGTWHTPGDGGGTGSQCCYALLNSTDTSNIADNNNFDGPETVTVTGHAAFQISGPCTWTLES